MQDLKPLAVDCYIMLWSHPSPSSSQNGRLKVLLTMERIGTKILAVVELWSHYRELGFQNKTSKE